MHPLFENSDRQLKARVQRAGVLNLMSRGVNVVCQFVGLTVLAHHLPADDFGVVSMVTPFIAVIMILGDIGLASAVLQQRDMTEAQGSAVMRINVIAGLGLGLIFLACSPLFGWLYNDARVSGVASILSLVFVFSGLTAVQQALLRRALRFGSLFRAEVSASIISVSVSIAAAYAGLGYWALVLRTVVHPFVYAISVWISARWWPGRADWTGATRSMIRYGGFFVGFSLLNTTGRQADNVLIGWRYGSVELGGYALAYRIFLLPVQQITGPLGHVMIPAFSRLSGEPERLRSWYLKILRLITFLAFPPFFGLALCSHDVVRLVAGPGWEKAATILSLLAPVGALHVGYTTIGWLMQSQGRADRSFYWALIAIPGYLLSFVIGLPWGAEGVATAYAIANVILFVPGFAFSTRGTSITTWDTLRTMVPCFGIAGISCAGVYVTQLMAADVGVVVRLLLDGAVIATVMIVGSIPLFGIGQIRDAFFQLVSLAKPIRLGKPLQ